MKGPLFSYDSDHEAVEHVQLKKESRKMLIPTITPEN